MTSIHLKLPISMHKENNLFVAICRVFPVVSHGKTEEEALFNVKEDLKLFLKDENVQKEFSDTIKEYMDSKYDTICGIEVIDC